MPSQIFDVFPQKKKKIDVGSVDGGLCHSRREWLQRLVPELRAFSPASAVFL
jgi:hypothetical protein